MIEIIQGDALTELAKLPAASVQCCVTSPPYWGLRDYGTASWEGGDAGCDHRKVDDPVFSVSSSTLDGGKKTTGHLQEGYKVECGRCGARRIDSQLGLEETSEEYVANMVGVFREVWRVLKSDGTCWINLGDSFGVGANLSDCISTRIKGSVLCLGAACTLTITAKGKNVLGLDKSFPNGEFARLFGLKRIFLKQRNNYLGQVVDLLNSESCVVVDASLSFLPISESDIEIALDHGDYISVVVSEHDLNTDAPFEISMNSRAAENRKTAFAVKESAEPVTECVSNGETAWDAISFDALGKSSLQIDAVNEPVSFRDAAVSRTDGIGNFAVSKASREKLAFSLMQGAVEIALGSVGHVYFRNGFGSLISYTEIYDQAYRDLREDGAKQELGIPFRLRRALVRDGWICRSTIIWHKPNPMPESVTDRRTKSHEYIFLLTKSQRYYYDADAIKQPAIRTGFLVSDRVNRRSVWTINEANRDDYPRIEGTGTNTDNVFICPGCGQGSRDQNRDTNGLRDKLSVWTIATQPYAEGHFATFPEEIPKLCILAGSRSCDTILDPFAGSGTVGKVALELGRKAILIELNANYIRLIKERTVTTPGLCFPTQAEFQWADVPVNGNGNGSYK